MVAVASRQLSNFEVRFQPGLVADETPFKLGQAGYVSSNGVRPHRAGMETSGGYESYTASQVGGKARGLIAWTDNDNLLNLAVGTHSALNVEVGGALVDITPTSGFSAGNEHGLGGAGYGTGGYGSGGYGSASTTASYPLTWTGGQFGENLIINPRGQGVFRWQNDTAAPAALLTGAPAQCDTILVRKDQVIAYGCSEEISGSYNPRCIRWSALVAESTGITDWTTSSGDNAGEYVLHDTGRIIRAIELGSDIYVFTDDGVYLQAFLGAPNQLWFFNRWAENCGLVAPHAITKIGQTAFWLDKEYELWAMPAGASPVKIENPNSKDFRDNVAPAQFDKIWASTRTNFNEVRFDYPDARDGDGIENSRYITYNLRDKVFGGGRDARTASIDAKTTLYPVSVTPDGDIIYEEKGRSANGDQLARSCRTGFFYFAEGGRMATLRRMWCDFDDQVGPLSLTVYTRNEPRGAETSWGPFQVNPTSTFVDLGHITGALFSLEWSSSEAESFWRLGKITFDGVLRGRGVR